MSRQIEFTGSPADCALLLERLQKQEGIARILLQRGAGQQPEGDVVVIEAANQASEEILNMLSDLGLLHAGAVSITEPNATIRAQAAATINEEGNDAIWEEIGTMMRQDTNPSFNFIALMALAGAVAAFGIASDTIHVVVGAMLIAPGFEPLLRIVFGIAGDRHSTRAGLRSTALGYAALAIAAAAATPVALAATGTSAEDLAQAYWANYWSSIKADGLATSVLAGVAGGIIVSSRLKVLATGVMVALALIPSMALVGMGLATGNTEMMLNAAGRWAVEAACVIFAGGAVIMAKRRRHRR
ncbi:DUF389 domain-containing protein [Falsirhodobacter deserti]|uniref:DUF389 domain-containing protein n=1 Tax=Falsirhodobacter deserti TaxID=1365611 RepID=UPI0013E28B80|nr:DUF389 domain-containing protein [Falsirhodobacter deserti]